LGDPATAVDLLRSVDLSDTSHEVAAEALALQCYSLFVLKRAEHASDIAVEARARCFSAGLIGIEAELLFASAMSSVRDGELVVAESVAFSILELLDEQPSWVSTRTYLYSLNYWRARACDVLGSIESLRANYSESAEWRRRAFDEFDKSGVHDDYVLVLLLANYADAAVALGSKEIIDFIVERCNVVSWNPDLATHEYRVFSLLAEAASMTGDQIGALRYFRRCLDCAPNAALQIRVAVERGRLLHDIGESFASREEIDHALRLSRSYNWEASTAIEHRQLLFLAAQVARFDGPQAVAMLTRYDSLEANSHVGFFVKDDRFRGDEFMARAAIFSANGCKDRAVMLLIDALDTFSAGKLESRAALAAAELAALTNESKYFEIVRKQCAKQPHSILARRFANVEFDRKGETPAVTVAPDLAAAFRPRPKLELLS
jgi:tetratricopeptide (TPR) repeat protein